MKPNSPQSDSKPFQSISKNRKNQIKYLAKPNPKNSRIFNLMKVAGTAISKKNCQAKIIF